MGKKSIKNGIWNKEVFKKQSNKKIGFSNATNNCQIDFNNCNNTSNTVIHLLMFLLKQS